MKVMVTTEDRISAVDLVRAVLDGDSRLWDAEVRDAYRRYGAVEGVLHSLADLVLDELAADVSGDQVEIRRRLLTRREMFEVEGRR